MKKYWNNLKRDWHLLNPYQRVRVIFYLAVYVCCLLIIAIMSTENIAEPAVKTVVEEDVQTETRFPARDFTDVKLKTKYELGTWDGSFVRSEEGTDVASVDQYGYLWLNCRRYAKVADTLPDKFDHFDTVYLKDAALNRPILDGNVERYNFTTKTSEVLLKNVVVTGFSKVAKDAARFLIHEYDEDGNLALCRLMEVHSTGPAVEICSAPHSLAVRAIDDYPEEGDMSEFWLLRHAYTRGVWNGQPESLARIAELLDVDLSRAPTADIANLRNPKLSALDYSNLNPESIAYVNYNRIVVDNVEKYYLHATRPFLVDGIKYRKISDVNGGGFIEIDDGTRENYWDRNGMPLYGSPVCRFSYAPSPNEYGTSTRNLSTVAIKLPFFDGLSKARGEEVPAEFIDRLEVIDADNYDNDLRAILLGHYTSFNPDNPEATFTAYLSRNNSLFTAITSEVTAGFITGQFNNDYVAGNNPYIAPNEYSSLYLYGHAKAAVIENIFTYDNSLQVFDYSDPSADAE